MPDEELATYTERTDYAAKGVIMKIVNLGKDDETEYCRIQKMNFGLIKELSLKQDIKQNWKKNMNIFI